MTDIADNLAALRSELAMLSMPPATLVAVSKTKPVEDVKAALAAGQRIFGENRVQEAIAKFAPLRARVPDLELHLIGPLQTNKVKEAVQNFDVIETVDRPKLAQALADALAKQPGRLRQVLIEVNTGEEPQKAGILPADADDFIRDCVERLKLPVGGLMCIPPADDEPSLHFALLRDMARRHGLPVLSMGMSGDYRIAAKLGATHVRIGTAIFGARDMGH
ncbi:MAG TPA: YggS family pyridoxal phosphate-dependent enzyme [Aliidongia sp.]|nr:YggS family pyridoxal phosphate-dependent enzyme [Aliidongia sp.]